MRTIPQIISWSPRYRLYAVSLQIELELTVELLCCVYNLPRICSISPARLSHRLLSNIAIAEENIYILFTPDSCSGMSSCHRGVTSLHQPVTYQIRPTWHCSKLLIVSSQTPMLHCKLWCSATSFIHPCDNLRHQTKVARHYFWNVLKSIHTIIYCGVFETLNNIEWEHWIG